MSAEKASSYRPIATLQEGPLHAALKAWYVCEGDGTEVPVDGRQVDIVRGDLLIEIQTRSFAALRKKLERLLEDHPVRLVHPVAREKWIVRVDDDEQVSERRASSRWKGSEETRSEIFDALAMLREASVVPELTRLYEGEDGDARLFPMKALAAIGDDAAMQFLRERGTRDPEPGCQQLATRATAR